MQKYLVGVGVVRAFIDDELFFTGKTLIDTSMEIAISNTDIRGGQGNVLLAQYFHSSSLNLTITDAQFRLPVLALNVGSPMATVGGRIFGREEVTLVGNGGTLTNVAYDQIALVGEETTKKVYIDYNDTYYSLDLGADLTFSTEGTSIPSGATICVAYLYNNANSETYTIPANYIPSRVHMFITVPITGDKAGQGMVGEETIEIPIFQLGGGQTISMTADGVSNTSLSGYAIATSDAGVCESSGHYATITETIYGSTWYEGVTALAIAGGDFTLNGIGSTSTLKVYAVKGGRSFLCDNSQLTFMSGTPATATIGAHTGIVTTVAADSTLLTAYIAQEVSGYASFDATSKYVGYYILKNGSMILVTSTNKDSLSITPGTTIAYTGKPDIEASCTLTVTNS